MLVAGTNRPRSPHLVDHVVLDLEQDVDGDVGNRLSTVEREGVTAEPTSQPQLVVFVVVLIAVRIAVAEEPESGFSASSKIQSS